MTKFFLLPSLICLVGNIFAQTGAPGFARPEQLPPSVNSSAEESLPLVAPDGTLYFTRTFHSGNSGGQDIWTSASSGDQFAEAKNLKKFNNSGNNVVVGIAKNGKRFYFLNHKSGGKKSTAGVSYADYDTGSDSWSQTVQVTIPELVVEGDFYSAYVSPNENYILWSIPGTGESASNDLFVSLSPDAGSSWSAPKWLGSIINTGDDEISPYYDESRKLLFFSSKGHDGMGDYDIFFSRRLDDSWLTWTSPQPATNLNSTGFDAYYFSQPDGTVYFSSNRGDTLSNIFVSQISDPKEIDEEETDELSDARDGIESDTDRVGETRPKEKSAMPDPVLIIETKDGIITTDRKLSSLTREELLDKGTTIRFVYFPYDKYNITEKYIEVMDDAGFLLDKYPDIKVIITGHTDAVGSQPYNMVLSQNRADATKEYLMIHGIEPDRIDTEGHGKATPYATNLTEDGRALNRRVEMRFLLMK